MPAGGERHRHRGRLGSAVTGACVALFALSLVHPATAQILFAGHVMEDREHCVVDVATWDRLNVRSGPSADDDVVAKLQYGECGITVLAECDGDWCPIKANSVEGWVNSRYISVVSLPFYCANDDGNDLTLRAFPSPTSRVVVVIESSSCDIASLPYFADGWYKIRANGYEGWIEGQLIKGQ